MGFGYCEIFKEVELLINYRLLADLKDTWTPNKFKLQQHTLNFTIIIVLYTEKLSDQFWAFLMI